MQPGVASNLNASEEMLAGLLCRLKKTGNCFWRSAVNLTGSGVRLSSRESSYLQVSGCSLTCSDRLILKIAASHFNSKLEAVEELGLTPEEIELAAIPTNVNPFFISYGPIDAFLTHDSSGFVRAECRKPLQGVGYLHKLCTSLPVNCRFFREFIKRTPGSVLHSPLWTILLIGLLRTYYEEFDGREENQTFRQLFDFQDIPTIH